MPEEQRAVLYLVCVEELSYKDAASVLGLPIGPVTSRPARARIALRDFADGRPPVKFAAAARKGTRS
ncbi:MAG: hypothetical protein FJX56_12800 [Alphaproteobacteria bacterium]|nr:hypothetical protein [Alphaproteobacteria bacterium]